MKKIIIFIVFAALIGLGIHQMKQVYQPGAQPSVDIETLPAITGEDTIVPTEQTFAASGVSFVYPTALGIEPLKDRVWRTNTQVGGTTIASVTIPRTMQPNTNFSEAWFTVGSSTDQQALKECLVPTNGERAKGEVIISDVTFKKITLTDAGAGNYYDTTSYRTIKDNTCYAVEYTIHSTNLRNYDPGTVTEFDMQSVVNTLEGMVQSFKFTD